MGIELRREEIVTSAPWWGWGRGDGRGEGGLGVAMTVGGGSSSGWRARRDWRRRLTGAQTEERLVQAEAAQGVAAAVVVGKTASEGTLLSDG